MNASKSILITALITASVIVGIDIVEAKGPPVKVNESIPAEGEQGEPRFLVTLRGKGFEANPNILYYLSGLPDGSPPVATLAVSNVNFIDSEEIQYELEIDAGADIGDYDIEVSYSNGRKGKGTTLFTVWSSDPCDRDGDNWRKGSASCDIPGYAGIDCNDQDPTVQACDSPGGDTFTPVEIRVGFYDAVTGDLLEDASPYTGDPDFHEFGDGWINWDANTLTDADLPRPCRVTAVTDDPPGSGRYDCFEDASNGSQWPHGGKVSIDISQMSWTEVTPPRRGWKNPELCDLIDSFDDLTFGATRYQIHFTQGCVSDGTDADCPMTVRGTSYSGSGDPIADEVVQLHDFHDLPGYPGIGRLNVRGYVDPRSITFPPAGSGELNVFTVDQALVIDRFRVSFESVKNGALLAQCETVPGTVSGIEAWTWYSALPAQ